MASRPIGKRLPISCEPCRKRKIKCTRDRRPCQTCLRRGLRAADCIFLGQPRPLLDENSETETNVQRELLERIQNLEDLLHRRIDTQLSPQNSDAVSPPITTISNPVPEQESDHIHTESVLYNLANCGSLQLSPSGHVRYLPLSSQWNSVFSKHDAGTHLEELNEVDIPHDEDAGFPFSSYDHITKAEFLSLLPPRRYCDYLKDIYFQVFSPLFHILHDPTFEEEYQKFYEDPSSVSLAWLALLFIILGIAATGLEDDDPLLSDLGYEKSISSNIRVISSRYRCAAMRCLAADGVMSRHSIRSLQALVLTLYARSHMNIPIWTLLGFTHHVAIAMGCHIDPARFSLSTLECEERRRAWAGLLMIYTIQNTAFGCFGHQPFSQDTKLPSDVNDTDLIANSYIAHRTEPTQMTYILLKFRLYQISSKICEDLFSFIDRPQPTSTQLENEVIYIQSLCTSRYLSDSNQQHLPSYHMANFNILQGYIHQLRLLIHRPSFTRYFEGNHSQMMRESRDKCVESAKGLLAIYRNLSESPDFAPYKWYTSGLGSFHAFHAAVVLAAILMNPDNKAEYDDIKHLLLSSLDLFTAFSHRSSVCDKAVTILQNLIDVADSRRRQFPDNATRKTRIWNRQIDMISAQLDPQHWLSPSLVAWDGWDFLRDELVPS